mmetsp:Transcript_56119/g.105252  ORF Transcript_56119/g.105252 Transcript_56119/m.105252 type:complete len:216 (+) Transcript_56119:211-858(+)
MLHGDQLLLNALHQKFRQAGREVGHSEVRRVHRLEHRVVCEKNHLRHSRLRGGGAVVELFLGAVLAHDVAQLQRLAHVVQHRQHLVFGARADEVWFGQHPNRPNSVGIRHGSALQNVHRRNVLVARDDGEDDGALLAEVVVDEPVHFVDHPRILPLSCRAHDPRQVDHREVGRRVGHELDDDGLRGEPPACPRQGIRELLDHAGELGRGVDFQLC